MEELNRIQKELKVPKGQVNKFGKYKYRSCEDILEAVKKVLGKCTLTINDSMELIGDRFYIKATATLRHGEKSINVSAFAREPLIQKGMSESQITGSASSYARKYALNGLFAIDDTKDPDTQDNREPIENAPFEKLKAEYFSLLKKFYNNNIPADEIAIAKKMSMDTMIKTMTGLELELNK